MKKIIVANLKMNLTLEEVEQYLKIIKGKITDKLEVIICPSFPFLSLFKSKEYKLGAQNTFYLEKGSYTGEVSPLQLKTIGTEYVIVGHSERRLDFKEDNNLINKKVLAILRQNMKPIICVGETLEEKLLHRTTNIIKKQIDGGLNNVDQDMLTDVIIAYEPVWAIGSDKTPTNSEITEIIQFIKDYIISKYKIEYIKVLYGGSVNIRNIKEIMNINNVDGVLMASASIDSQNFLDVLKLIE